MAVGKHFGHSVDGVPLPSIDEVFREAETGATQFAVVPVENSTEGAVGRTLDLLLQTPLAICAEVVLRVHQNLMAKGDSLAGVARVYTPKDFNLNAIFGEIAQIVAESAAG